MSFRRALFGLFFVAVGALWLLDTLGIIALRARDLWSIAAPLFLVLIGLSLLLRWSGHARKQ
ncbi:MAG: DUF5668 domain-containing protein [Chloroflexota bacterium]